MAKNVYFGPGLFQFLKKLKLHNEREWFLANQQVYEEEVRQPFLRLIADLAPGLKKINPDFVADPKPNGGSMMRIHRDIRFSKDKSPYKTFVAAHFCYGKGRDGSAPAYYLRLEPVGSVIGGGIWQPEQKVLKKIRDRIVAQPNAWLAAISHQELGSTCSLAGESLKRSPPGYDADHPLIEDIKRKDFAISSRLADSEVVGDDLLDAVLERFRTAAPFLKFLSGAVGLSPGRR